MTGGSYFGHTQWAVAPYADPPLVAVSPHIAAAQVDAWSSTTTACRRCRPR